MTSSYYDKPWVWLPTIEITKSDLATITSLLNKRFKHSEPQIGKICIAIKGALEEQAIHDKEASLIRQPTNYESAKQLQKLQGHLAKAQEIIRTEFGLHTEAFIEQHYLLKTKTLLPSSFQGTDKGPVEHMLHNLEVAVTNTIEEIYSDLGKAKKQPRNKTAQYRNLICSIARGCKEAEVQFVLKHKENTPFYRLIEWVIVHKMQREEKNFEQQIKSALVIVSKK